MSYRDDSSSTFHGGGGYSRSGNPGSNGEVGGGMGGGFGGGGGARNGGFNSSTGLTTGNKMNSSTQRGRPGSISEELAALFKASQPRAPKAGAPKVARPVTQPPLPTYVEPPPVIEDVPPPPYTEPETVPGVPAPPEPVGMSPKPSFNKYAALDYYKSAYGPESYSFGGLRGIGTAGMVRAADRYNKAQGYDHGISGAFNDKYGKK